MTQNAKIITQKDVANLAGVSRSVVSYVLNDGPRSVAPETKKRILDAIEELGYHPNKNAQRLKLGSTSAERCVGIIIGGRSFSFVEHAYYNSILSKLFEKVHQHEQEIRFFSCLEALTDPVYLNKNIHPEEISSLILILPSMIDPSPEDKKIFTQIARRIGNVVCLGVPIKNWPTVTYDQSLAAQQAVEHLIDLGHQRIAHLGIPDDRLTGYHLALENHGLTYDESLVAFPDPGNIYNSSYQLIERFLQAAPRPTALFTASDEIAFGAMAALHDHGVAIPRDMAITSIDDIELASIVRPSLTTVNIPRLEMVSMAMQVLTDSQNGRKPKTETIVLPTKLIIRESCGANQ